MQVIIPYIAKFYFGNIAQTLPSYHCNTAEWEEENGSQLLLMARTIDSALAMGLIATGKAK